jgi:hypothetical protein
MCRTERNQRILCNGGQLWARCTNEHVFAQQVTKLHKNAQSFIILRIFSCPYCAILYTFATDKNCCPNLHSISHHFICNPVHMTINDNESDIVCQPLHSIACPGTVQFCVDSCKSAQFCNLLLVGMAYAISICRSSDGGQ